MVGRQTPLLALFVPLLLVYVVDGRRGLRQTWLPAIVCGVAFSIGQFVSANFISVPLADIIASLAGALAVVALLRVWQPVESPVLAVPRGGAPGTEGAEGGADGTTVDAAGGTGGTGVGRGRGGSGGGAADGRRRATAPSASARSSTPAPRSPRPTRRTRSSSRSSRSPTSRR